MSEYVKLTGLSGGEILVSVDHVGDLVFLATDSFGRSVEVTGTYGVQDLANLIGEALGLREELEGEFELLQDEVYELRHEVYERDEEIEVLEARVAELEDALAEARSLS